MIYIFTEILVVVVVADVVLDVDDVVVDAVGLQVRNLGSFICWSYQVS